jgi:hypothetical protein
MRRSERVRVWVRLWVGVFKRGLRTQIGMDRVVIKIGVVDTVNVRA